jgi:hypothetical protein
MFILILSTELLADIAEKTHALARAYIQAGCLEEGRAIQYAALRLAHPGIDIDLRPTKAVRRVIILVI